MPETTRHQGAVAATLAGILDRLRPSGGVSLRDDERFDGRVVLVTGASRGLGRAIAEALGRRGATVHVAVRSLAEETVAAVRAAGAPEARAWRLDLERLDVVDRLVDDLAAAGVRLDVLVLNAGVVPASSRETPHGLDVMLQVNALANVHLVDRLLARGVLRPATPAPRVVVVGSEAHRSSPPIDWTDLGAPRRYTTSEVVAEYGRSKLVLHSWVCELARRLDGPGDHVDVFHLCPGAVASEIAREAPKWAQPLLNGVFKLFFQSPATAAAPAVYFAAASEPGATGSYLHMRRRTEPAALASDAANGAAAWAAAHTLLAKVHPEGANDVHGQP